MQLFLNYLNEQHNNIKFTAEIECDNSINFLDILISKENNKYVTSTYRKPTVTGLGMLYTSHVPKSFKDNLIKCLVFRAFKISSTLSAFETELSFLKKYFMNNKFPEFILNTKFMEIIKGIYNPIPKLHYVERKNIFMKLPYLGFQSLKIKRELVSIINQFYPQLKINIIYTNFNRIGNFFRYKDRIPTSLASSVIYNYCCEQCSSTYVGQTRKQMKVRISNHKNISFRTGASLTTPGNSSIFDHFISTGHPIKDNNFKILTSCNTMICFCLNLFILII